MPTLSRVALGILGENAACVELERRGYAVLARRYHTRAGEIDIVAMDGPTLVFVEVKARTTADYGDPAEAVTLQKQGRVAAMARDYLAKTEVVDVPCRFDVVTVVLDERGEAVALTLYPNAFDAPEEG
ncbi:MAG: YraN family protein [Acidobacteria bacterium]|nr:MAG: YraN family protein [Acidobacteriota bacterium]